MKDLLKKAVSWSGGCLFQFCSKYVFALKTHFDKSAQLEWHYNQAHHGKGPTDGVNRSIKRGVFQQ